jgi:hypothetical protein
MQKSQKREGFISKCVAAFQDNLPVSLRYIRRMLDAAKGYNFVSTSETWMKSFRLCTVSQYPGRNSDYDERITCAA